MSHLGIEYAKSQVNSANQPNAKFWSDHRNGDNSMELNLTQGESRDGYYNLLFMNHPGQRTVSGWVGANDIDSLWIPPNWHMRADACGNTNHCNSGQTVAEYDGAGGNAGFSGLYWPIQDAINANNIDTIHLTQKNDLDETDPDDTKTVPYTWNRFKGKCCAGALPAAQCGIHVRGVSGSDCNQVFKNCQGVDLKIPYGSNPSYRSQYCAAMAKADTSIGDTIKQQYCISNPADSFCSCINLTNTAEYIRWSQAMNAKHPEIVISPLMYMDEAGYNPCRKHLTTDMQTQFIPSELLAQIGHLPTAYSITDLTVSGNNNILSDINITNKPIDSHSQKPASTPSDSSSDPSSDPSSDSSSDFFMLIILIVIAAICYWIFTNFQQPPTNFQQPPTNFQQINYSY